MFLAEMETEEEEKVGQSSERLSSFNSVSSLRLAAMSFISHM